MVNFNLANCKRSNGPNFGLKPRAKLHNLFHHSPLDVRDELVRHVSVGGGHVLAGLLRGRAELPEGVLGDVGVEDAEVVEVEDDVGHRALAEVLRGEGGHHEHAFLCAGDNENKVMVAAPFERLTFTF